MIETKTIAETYQSEDDLERELKKRGVAIREAFNQVHRYSKESFNSEHSLFKFLQLFVISNGSLPPLQPSVKTSDATGRQIFLTTQLDLVCVSSYPVPSFCAYEHPRVSSQGII